MAREDFAKYLTVGEVIGAIRVLAAKGGSLLDDGNEGLEIAVLVLLSTQGRTDINYATDLKSTLEALSLIPEDEKIEDLRKEQEKKEAEAQRQETEKEAATARVPTEKIKDLLEEYETLIKREGLKEEEAARRVEEREGGRIAKERIRQWIRQQEAYQKRAMEMLEKTAPKLSREEKELVAAKTAERQVTLGEEVRVMEGREETVAKVVAEVGETCVQAASGNKTNEREIKKTLKELKKELSQDIGKMVAEEIKAIPKRVADEIKAEKIKTEVVEEIVNSLRKDGVINNKKQEESLRKVLEGEVENVMGGGGEERAINKERKLGLAETVARTIGTTEQIVGKEAGTEILRADQHLAEIREQVGRVAKNMVAKIEKETGSLGKVKMAGLKVRIEKEIGLQLAKTSIRPEVLIKVISEEISLPEIKIVEVVRGQSKGLQKLSGVNQKYFQNIIEGIGKGAIVRRKIEQLEGTEGKVALEMVVADWWREKLKGEEDVEQSLPTNFRQAVETTGTPAEEVGLHLKRLNVALTKLETTDKSLKTIKGETLENRIERNLWARRPSADPRTVWQYRKLVRDLYYPDKEKEISVYQAGARLFTEGRGSSPGKVDEAWNELRGITGFLRMSPKRLDDFLAKYKQTREVLGVDKLPMNIGECRSLEGLVRLIEEVPQVKQLLNFTQYFTALTGKVNALTGGLLQKVGLEKIGLSVAERVGGQAVAEFVKHSLAVLAEQGTQKGLLAILNGVLGGGVSAGSTAAAAGGGTALASAVAAFQAIPIVGQVILVAALVVAAAVVTYNTAIKPIIKGIKNAINGVLGWFGADLDSISPGIKKLVSQDLGLGNFIGGLADFGFKAGVAIGAAVIVPLVAIPTLLATMSMAALGPIVAILFIGLMVLQQVDLSPKIAGLTPPRGTGGGCISRSGGDVSGEANCNPNLPDVTLDGIGGKNEYAKNVDEFYTRGGKNSAVKCFNHAVCLAKSAGVNPGIALTTWLSESAASNYDTTNGLDFGINISSVPKRNFMLQIEKYLTQPAGMLAECRSKYPNNTETEVFFATFVRTTAGDCPDPNSGEGQKYVELQRMIYAKIAGGADFPSSPFISATSNDCGGEGGEGWGLSDEGWCDVGAGVGGSAVVPVAPPDWTPGPVPEGCPDRLPVNGGFYTQGPYAPQCSHQNMSSPAIDIGIGFGEPIYATHPGKARAGADGIYGNYVEVQGQCNGIVFTTKYAHMPEIPFSGVIEVQAGVQIGAVDNTGSSTGNHIHYHITGLDKNNFCSYLGITTVETCNQLWGCCGSDNGKYCP